MLVDSHCHLDFPDFTAGLEDTVARARNAGVGHMLTICTLVRNFPEVLAVAERFPEVTCSVGTHPHSAGQELDVTVAQLVELTAHPRVVAIGEAGLDYFYLKSSAEDQQTVFRRHIAAARETGLPLVIHARDCDDDAAQILREEMANGPFKAVLHCYTGGRALAETGIELGFYVSFSGILTFPKLGALRELAASCRWTGCSWKPTRRFSPRLRTAASGTSRPSSAIPPRFWRRLKGVSEAEVDKVTTANFFTLFSKAEAAVGGAA